MQNYFFISNSKYIITAIRVDVNLIHSRSEVLNLYTILTALEAEVL